MVIVEQQPSVVLKTIQNNPATWEWFKNEWVRLVCFDPVQHAFYCLQKGEFQPYVVVEEHLPLVDDVLSLIADTPENFPIVELKQKAS